MQELVNELDWGPFTKDLSGLNQREVFICTFSIISRLVGSDGDLSPAELQLIDTIMKESLKLDSEKRKFVSMIFNAARKSKVPFQEFVTRYKELLAGKPQMYTWLGDVLLQLSIADGRLDVEEMKIIDFVFSTLGLDEEKLKKFKAERKK